MKTAGTFALAGFAKGFPKFQDPETPRIAVFFDGTFPGVEDLHISRTALEEAFRGWNAAFLNNMQLSTLTGSRCDLLVMPYGSAFPKDSWSPVHAYLMEGGNLLWLGGVPFAVPVRSEYGGWHQEVRQTEYHKLLGLTQAYPVSPEIVESYSVSDEFPGGRDLVRGLKAEKFFEFYVKFTSTKDYPSEDGSAGQRDAILNPLILGVDGLKTNRVAPVVQIDRMQGECAGGRWLVVAMSGTIPASAIRALASQAMQGATELNARSSSACYAEGESPAVTIQLRHPKGNVQRLAQGKCRVVVKGDDGKNLAETSIPLFGAGTLATGNAVLPSHTRGITHVRLSLESPAVGSGPRQILTARTGYWITDDRLLSAGKPLSIEGANFIRDGQPYPITGTTYMASDVHRKFLLDPNPAVWDDDFRRMKSAGINMVRTGIWTAWKNYMLDVGSPNEQAFRAMDAFLLTARKYDMPVIITLFAFLPESWGGVNPFLDPRSVNAQKEFLLAFVQRYRMMNDVMWDLINEPSFCNPQQLWSVRPNYDTYEVAAWEAWLKSRYHFDRDQDRIASLSEMYRCPPGEVLALPKLEEFSDVIFFDTNHPIKVIDYRLFAQEMVTRWAGELRELVRTNGNPGQLVTIGQDEGGTSDRPSPQFYASGVDFTCLHNWWNNDDLLWDSVMTKVPGKLNLIEETGVMFYEKMDGTPWRTEEDARNLLERKLAISLSGNSAGFIEWVWNTNPYMDSDNEAAIGVFRAAGTAKPEFDVIRRFAKFFASNRQFVKGKVDEDVLMVISHSNQFSTRDLVTEATRRCVRVMAYNHHVPVAAVSEYGMGKLSRQPKLIILPSSRTLNESAWNAVRSMVESGSNLLISGPVDTDDHWLPQERMKALGVESAIMPIAEEESLSIDGVRFVLGYRGDKLQRVEKAVIVGSAEPSVQTISHGKGNIFWSPLPVELAESPESVTALYRYVLKQTGIVSAVEVEDAHSSVLVLPTVYEHAVLCTCVSESSEAEEATVAYRGKRTKTTVPAGRSRMIFLDRASGEIISQLEG
ncbi:MAG TPA: cellulase family glycosylhydrolase [Bacteroidota bacterium]|nr:cellulase family glycosylhydrolase [Bacteroidota bacterium]